MTLRRTAEVEIGEDESSLVVTMELAILPGFKGNGNRWTAASDIDYYGEPPSVDDIESVTVIDATGVERKPSPDEDARIDAFLASPAGQSWQDDQAVAAVEDECDGEP